MSTHHFGQLIAHKKRLRDIPRKTYVAQVNTSEASIARVYDAVIGGKDNFAVDREVAEATLGSHPAMPRITKSGRRWLVRVV